MQGIRHSLLQPDWPLKHNKDDNNRSDDDCDSLDSWGGASLESLDWGNEDDVSQNRGGVDLKPSVEDRMEEATQKAVEIYKKFAFKDSLIELQKEYKRKTGLDSIDEYFEFIECPTRERNKKCHYRRCVFRCPQSEDMRKVTSSCLPLPMLLAEGTNITPKDYLIEHTGIFLGGSYGIFEDGMVYFESRTAAKKSTALKRLLEIHLDYSTQTTLFFESTMEASAFLRQHSSSASNPPKTNPTPSTTSAPSITVSGLQLPALQHKRLPNWVHKLSVAGVYGDTSHLSIQYRECLDEKQMKPTYWTGQPTLLRCVMEVTRPNKVQVVGLPFSSKKETRDSAVELLIDKLGTQNNHTVDWESNSTTHSTATATKTNTKKTKNRKRKKKREKKKGATDDMDNKKKIYACDKQKTTFAFPLPSWARQEFSTTSSQSATHHLAYLYELELKESSGKSFVAERLGLPESDLTTIAVIFPADIEPPGGAHKLDHDPFQTMFQLPSQTQDSGDHVVVNLRHRSVLDLSDSNPSRQLERAMQFTQLFASGSYHCNPTRSATKASPRTRHGIARTYLFVLVSNSKRAGPHTVASIDWDLMEDITNHKLTPFLQPKPPSRVIAWIEGSGIGVCPWSCFGFLAVLTFHILSTCINSDHIAMAWAHLSEDQRQFLHATLEFVAVNWLLCSSLLVLLTVGATAAQRAFFRNPKVHFPTLNNRLLISRHNPHIVYHFGRVSSLTCLSPLSSVMAKINKSTKLILSRHCLDFDTIPFSCFLFKKNGEVIRYPRQPLLEATVLHLESLLRESCQGAKSPEEAKFLIPEHVASEPMPLDVLFVATISRNFLPRLERKISLIWFYHSAGQLQSSCPTCVEERDAGVSIVAKRLQEQCTFSFLQLLDEATTIHPVTYQRLEFLGDSVLGYVLALNTMARNSTLAWDYDDLFRMVSNGGKNTALFGGALRAGLNHLLQTEGSPWLSAYSTDPDKGKPFDSAVRDFRMSDVVEAVLGAVFLGRHQESNDSIMSGLLEIVSLPLAEEEAKTRAEHSSASSKGWSRSPSHQCLRTGYSFCSDRLWRGALSEVAVNMSQSLKSRLAARFEKVIEKLEMTGCSIKRRTLTEQEKVLFYAALYDVNLRDADQGLDDSQKLAPERENGCQLALLRDTLSCVGGHALSMIITEEIFGRYPDANAADLHLLRQCALGKEIIGYVIVKTGMSSCFIDQKDQTAARYETLIHTADALGKDLWNQRGGWLLPGSASVYRSRCRSYGASRERYLQSGPRYPGIVAGHLLRDSKHKGANVDTGDLIFSFKALVGSMVLSFGVEDMWAIMGVYFEELLLLCPREVRSFKKLSPVVQACGPGTKEGKAKRLKYTILD